jgi:hypothetical protein
MSGFTPEQEQAIDDWLLSQEPPPMIAEEAEIENMAALCENAIVSAGELSADLDELMDCKLIKDKSVLRALQRAISEFLAEYDPEDA